MSKINVSSIIGLSLILVAAALQLPISSHADETASKQRPVKNDDAQTSDNSQQELTVAESELVNRIFGSRLLEIAAEYKRYDRVDQRLRWSPARCYVPKMPEQLGLLSSSDSKDTHGKKLYFLYARKPVSYRDNVSAFMRKKDAPVIAPLGQVLVKEAWNPVEFEPTKDNPIDTTKVHATQGKKTYYAGDKKALFIMFKTNPGTPGTDQGWVYGTVSADGKNITSVGLVKNCLQCHQDAPYDRQIGLSTPRFTPIISKKQVED